MTPLNMALGALTLVAVSCTTLAGQVSHTEDILAQGVCEIWVPITYDSSVDSTPTIDQIKINNRVRSAYCNGG